MNAKFKILPVLIILIFSGLACVSRTKEAPLQVITTSQDSLILENILNAFSEKKNLSTAELVVEIGKTFLGAPYVSSTLENGIEEKLVINLREMDCTTFAEYCMAAAYTVKSVNPDLGQFALELENIRYRNGKRDGYTSRLHYFSDWIYDNHMKRLVTEPADKIGTRIEKQINFMSTHPESYSILKENPELVDVIAAQEKAISTRTQFYLPKEEVEAKEADLKEGDIVGITTSIAGLDIAHVGILVKVDGRIHLLNASSLKNEVVISDEPLSDWLMSKKSYTGIMIARPE